MHHLNEMGYAKRGDRAGKYPVDNVTQLYLAHGLRKGVMHVVSKMSSSRKGKVFSILYRQDERCSRCFQ